VHALEAAGRSWRVAYSSPNLSGIQAAVSAGLGISILPDVAIPPDHEVLSEQVGFAAIEATELALIATCEAGSIVERLAVALISSCNSYDLRGCTFRVSVA
jgi:DNA-binding transcriptional LysR family regulator